MTKAKTSINSIYYDLLASQAAFGGLVDDTVKYELQGNLLKTTRYRLRKNHDAQKTEPRGAITQFSHRSRKRLLELTARLRITGRRNTFLTLTYHNNWPYPMEAKAQLRAFLKRLYRHIGSECAVVWRLEFQQRGAPHFHLMLFDVPYISWELLIAWWRDINDDYSITNLKVEQIWTGKKLRRYIAKYIAKSGDELGIFTAIPYLSATGRWWGCWHPERLPYDALVVIFRPADSVFFNLKRAARQKWKGVNKNGAHGFTLFVDNISRWQNYFAFLCTNAP